MRSIRSTLFLAFTLACGTTACSDGAEEGTPPSAEEDLSLSPSIDVDLDGVWTTFSQPRDVVSWLLPPELRLGAATGTSDTYPVVVLFNNLEVRHVGPLPVGFLTRAYGEIIVLIPSVEFRAASACASAGEQFNFVVGTYVGSRVSSVLARLTSSANAYDAEVSSRVESELFEGQSSSEGSPLFDLHVKHPDRAEGETPELFDTTWRNHSIAPGAIKKFARYSTELRPTFFQPAEGSAQTKTGFRGFRPQTIEFGKDGASAARMKGPLRIADVRQCD